jgi:transcriptional regulator with XRE-family HTH domain
MRFTKKTNLPRFAVVLAEARRFLNLEQAQLGEQIGVRGRTISRWESGLWMPMRGYHAGILEAFASVPPPLLRELTTLLVGVDPGDPASAAASAKATVADARATMEALVFRVAEDLDIGPRGVRTAIATVLEALDQAGLSIRAAREALVSPLSTPALRANKQGATRT